MNLPPLDETFRRPTMCQDESKRTCVEVAARAGAIVVRDSKNLTGATLTFTLDEWTAFVDGVKRGEFEAR